MESEGYLEKLLVNEFLRANLKRFESVEKQFRCNEDTLVHFILDHKKTLKVSELVPFRTISDYTDWINARGKILRNPLKRCSI